MPNVIDQHRNEVVELCRRAGARRLDAFGSSLCADFDPATSDLDFLVEFDDVPPAQYAEAYFFLKEGLESLFGRSVDSSLTAASPIPISAIASRPSAESSMHADSRKLLWDARQAAERVTRFTAGKTFTDYEGDDYLRSQPSNDSSRSSAKPSTNCGAWIP